MLQQVQQGLVYGLELAAPEGVAPGQQGLHIQHPHHTGQQFRISRCDQPADDGAVQIEIEGGQGPLLHAGEHGGQRPGENTAAVFLGGLELAQELHLVAHGVQHGQVGGQEAAELGLTLEGEESLIRRPEQQLSPLTLGGADLLQGVEHIVLVEGLEGQIESLRHGLDQLLVAGIASADEQPPLGHENGPQLLEFGDAVDPGGLARPLQGSAGHDPLAGLEAEVVDEQPEQFIVPDRHSLDGLRVDGHDAFQPVRVLLRQLDQMAAHRGGKFLPCGGQRLILIKILPRGGGPQAPGVEETLQKEGPGRQQGIPPLGQKHLLEIDAVPALGRGGGAVGEDIGHAADVGRLNGDGLQKLLLKKPLAKGEQLAAADAGEVGGDAVEPLRVAGQVDGDRQGQPVIAHQFGHLPGLEVVLHTGLGGQDHRRAHRALLQRLQSVGAVGQARPHMGHAARRRPGVDHDGVRHHEAGEQADAEPADVVLGDRSVDQLRLGGLADHRQKAVDALLAEPRAVVPKNQAAARFHGDGDLSAVPVRLFLLPQGDGVHAVLQQFPEEHIRAFIQVVGQHVQHPAQIYLKMIGVAHRFLSFLFSGFCRPVLICSRNF